MGIKTYKGFDKDLKCRGFQFEQGKEYVHEGPVKACESGFHSCEYPLDVFGYYAPAGSRFFEVESDGEISTHSSDSKVASSKIKIGLEIGIKGMVEAAVKFVFEKVDWENKKEFNTGYRSVATNTGDRSAATNTGDRSAATNTGDQSVATNTGDQSAATNTGDQSVATNTGDRSVASATGKASIACGLGVECTASGALGCWIVLAEREWDDKERVWSIKTIKAAKVDGKKIKQDVFYKLENGKFAEA